MSYARLKREDGASFHPRLIQNYQSKKTITEPKNIAKTKYGHLTEKSTYAEYAWEFLRRNKFYQSMIDSWNDEDEYTGNSFPLANWGYQQTAEWEPHCGLWGLETKEGKRIPFKHYASDYDDELAWFPIEYLKLTMCSYIGKSKPLEDMNTQMHVAFDLGHVFGPSANGLKKQLDLAYAEILKKLPTVEEKTGVGRNESMFGRDKNIPIQKGILRRYLYVVDKLTPKLKVKKDQTVEFAQLPLLKQIAGDIKDDLCTENSIDSIGKDANHAFDMVYKWHCLGLLSLNDNTKPESKE